MNRSPGVWFVLPTLLVLGLLIGFPVLYTAVLSVTDESGAYVGLANYQAMASSRITAIAVRNTAFFVGMSLILQILIGTAVGILLDQRFRGRAVVRSLVMLPWIVPGVVAATVWAWMFHSEFGVVNYLLTATGLLRQPVGWLTDPDIVLPALVTINTWKIFPFVAVMVLAGLQSVPEELYEAARIDGASFFHEVWHVMLPQLRPVLSALALLLMIWGLNAITIIYTITRGGPANSSLTLPIQIFRHGFESFEFHETAALSAMYFLLAAVLVAAYLRVARSAGPTAGG